MKKLYLITLFVLLLTPSAFAQLIAEGSNDANNPLGNGSWLWFRTGSYATSIVENCGLNLLGSNIQPVQIRSASLLVGYASGCNNYGQGNAYISGNVGIGRNNAQFNLDVNGTSGFKGDVTLYGYENNGDSNTNSPNLIFQGTNYAGASMISAPREESYGRRGLAIYTHSDASDTRNLTERLRITYQGKVGIGTSSPNAKLEVDGSLLTAGNSSNLDGLNLSYLANSAKTLIGWNRTRGAGEADFISNQGGGGVGGFAFYNHDNSNQERQLMWIRGDGAVYIGGNSAQGSLEVNGNIHTREVRVDIQNFPDFVFKSSYTLPSLTEVKNYIDQKGHLPGMPSEAEAIKEGISLGEMNKKLLQKVEELTLYLIEKDKEIKEMKTEIAKFKIRP